MNYTSFSFFNILLMYVSNRDPNCPHILYHEDNEALCCQKEIIYLHNIQKAIVTPWATRGLNMTWDSELAKAAQGIARKCKFKYEPVEHGKFQTGQNMFVKCSKSDDIQSNWSEAVQSWFSQDKVRPNYATTFGGTGQLTWRKLHSLSVGCGYANYKINQTQFFVHKGVELHLSEGLKDFCQLYVCLYGPI